MNIRAFPPRTKGTKIEDTELPMLSIIRDKNTRPVLLLLSIFTLIFSVLVPSYMALRYDNFWYPLDFYRMQIRGGDYIATYEAAKHWLADLPVYSTPDSMGRLYSYPIVHVLLFIPLALFSFKLSYWLWFGLTIILTVASCYLAARLFKAPWAAFLLSFALIAQSSFMIFQLERGQTDALILFLITAFLYLYVQGYSKPLVAAVFVLATILKIFPALWGLFFLLRREFKLLTYAALFFILAILCTDPTVWWSYVRDTVPAYSHYFLGYTVDHSLFYLFDSIIPVHTTALSYARATSLILLGLYTVNVLFNIHRDRYVLIEIAILSAIMEISTPWAANYKLILLLFVFLSPLSIQELTFVHRRPILFTVPLFLCFTLIVPLFSEYVLRLPYSWIAQLSPASTIPFNPLNPLIIERKVALGVFLILIYLLGLYTAATIQCYLPENRTKGLAHHFDRLLSSRIVSGISMVLALFMTAMALNYTKRAEHAVAEIVKETNSVQPMGPAVSGIGYRVTERGSGYHTLDLVFDAHSPLPRNYQVYVHAYSPNTTGELAISSGKNFFPDTITSLWPSNKRLHTQTTLPLPLDYTELHVGFFTLEDGSRYGPEAIFVRR